MSSKKNVTDDPWDIDLDRDMPLTAEDVAALERARQLRPLSPEQYQEWVDLIEKHHGSRPRDPYQPDEPFTL